MLEYAGIDWKRLKFAEIGSNGRKKLEMAKRTGMGGYTLKWLEMARNGY
jgi:hypothetical protein